MRAEIIHFTFPSGPKEIGNGFSTATLWQLVISFIGLLSVPFYNFYEPVLLGFPFFLLVPVRLGSGDSAPHIDCLPERPSANW